MTKILMIKTKIRSTIGLYVLNFEHLNFVFVSDFGFRASDFIRYALIYNSPRVARSS